jgi:hypothetical protein
LAATGRSLGWNFWMSTRVTVTWALAIRATSFYASRKVINKVMLQKNRKEIHVFFKLKSLNAYSGKSEPEFSRIGMFGDVISDSMVEFHCNNLFLVAGQRWKFRRHLRQNNKRIDKFCINIFLNNKMIINFK